MLEIEHQVPKLSERAVLQIRTKSVRKPARQAPQVLGRGIPLFDLVQDVVELRSQSLQNRAQTEVRDRRDGGKRRLGNAFKPRACKRSNRIGGACITCELIPGFKVSAAAQLLGMLRQRIIDDDLFGSGRHSH